MAGVHEVLSVRICWFLCWVYSYTLISWQTHWATPVIVSSSDQIQVEPNIQRGSLSSIRKDWYLFWERVNLLLFRWLVAPAIRHEIDVSYVWGGFTHPASKCLEFKPGGPPYSTQKTSISTCQVWQHAHSKQKPAEKSPQLRWGWINLEPKQNTLNFGQCSAVQGRVRVFHSILFQKALFMCVREKGESSRPSETGTPFPLLGRQLPTCNTMQCMHIATSGPEFFFFRNQTFSLPGKDPVGRRIRDGFVVWKPTSQHMLYYSVCTDTCRQNQMWGCHGVRWIPLFPTGRRKTSLVSSRQSSPGQISFTTHCKVCRFADSPSGGDAYVKRKM